MSEVSSQIEHEKWVKSQRKVANLRVKKCINYARKLWLMPYNHSELAHYRILERWNWI